MSISIEDFNANFLIHIRDLSRPHIDKTGTIPASVGFNIVCIPNNRVQFFEYHFNDQDLVDTSTDQILVDLAWTALKSDINMWADTVINKTNLIGYVYTPINNFDGILTLSQFNTFFEVNILNFEVYPANQPHSWRVGFNIINKFNNDDKMQIFTKVTVNTFAITSAEEDIMHEAWQNVKELVSNWANSKINTSNLINTYYTPISF